MPGATYVERCALSSVSRIRQAKAALKHAFELQVNGAKGLSLVEVLSTCPTNWGIPPAEATSWLEKNMLPYYPVGIFKTPEGGSREPKPLPV